MGRIGRTVKHQAGVFKRNSKTSNSKSLDTSLPDFNVQFGSLSTWTWHVLRVGSRPREFVRCRRLLQRRKAAIARGRTTGAAAARPPEVVVQPSLDHLRRLHKSKAVANPVLHPSLPPKPHENQADQDFAQKFHRCIPVAAASVGLRGCASRHKRSQER